MVQDVYHTTTLLAALAIAGCGTRSDPTGPVTDPNVAEEQQPDPEPEPEPSSGCEALAFVETIDVAEASGAELIDAGLMVVSDSGNDGDYVIVDPDTGAIRERGKLPLAEAAEDFEGLARRGDGVVALTSAGWVHEYRRLAGGFELSRPPYPIDTGSWHCEASETNCGPNWEGLCLGEVEIQGHRCDGFAVAKRDGTLVCVVGDDRLRLAPEIQVDVAPRRTLAGCAISAGRIWAVTNLLGANAILEVEADGAVTPRLSMAPGSTEAVAASGETVYRVSDTSNHPSIAGRYRCP